MADHPDINLARRRMLRKIGLGAGLAYIAPALSGLSVARASGGSGGGGSSGPSGPSRPGRGSGGSTRNSTRQREPRRVTQQQPARPPAPRPPEIVALVPAGQPLGPALAAGFTALAQNDLGLPDGVLVRFGLPQGRGLSDALADLGTLLPGTLADENHLYRPDDFLCEGADCGAHAMIGWTGWPSAMRPRLGMIDTGINTDHPALQGRRLTVHQVDLGERDSAGRQHGTAIAAMLVGSVEGRVPGLLPDATLIAVEAFHRSGSTEQADAFSVTSALDLMLRERVDAINMSFSGPANAVLERMVARAAEAGIALVAAAGNGGPGAEPAYPAAWPDVIAVTAVDHRERIYRQANQGPYVALAAPGVNVWTAASISGGRLRSGTSYAAPFVTAALAVERLRAPDLAVEEVTAQLFACARDLGEAGFDPVFGHGLVGAPGQCHGAGQVFSVSGE
ncbi:S8 family serine peptidase [Rhodovulum strictum]|uniref:S8 family serine peptidase n=1 Tax=Rhodovulum strictum TaxID=58314 RepID=A0A844BJP4_9RHOB|nr:S8 family serine peptidase [Rhodovulum strictum]MRH21795.1 S8 family serine peptidase [Rhodovulum strictum]